MQNLLARKYVNNFKKDGKKEKYMKDLSTLSIDDMKIWFYSTKTKTHYLKAFVNNLHNRPKGLQLS